MDAIPPSPTPAAAPPPAPLTPSEERTWAMLAHLSALINLVSGFLGIVVALGIYLLYKDRSQYVAYQAFQSFIFQLVTWGGGALLFAVSFFISFMLTFLLIGFLCAPLSFVLLGLPAVALIYSIYAGLQCNQGQDFRYWLVGDWATQWLPKA